VTRYHKLSIHEETIGEDFDNVSNVFGGKDFGLWQYAGRPVKATLDSWRGAGTVTLYKSVQKRWRLSVKS
jgi:hypothetical protein